MLNTFCPHFFLYFKVAIIELAIHGRRNFRNFINIAIRCLMWIQQYFFVYILCYMTVLYIKSISGFLRPHFLMGCMPDLAINCTEGEFIGSDYICTKPNTSDSLIFNFPRIFRWSLLFGICKGDYQGFHC